METELSCPWCGEPGEVDADVDPSEPGEHVFVQDCDVCCRPWTVRVTVGHDGEVAVALDRG
jgi:hypothetical protein